MMASLATEIEKEGWKKYLPEDFDEAKEIASVCIPTYQAIMTANIAGLTAILLEKKIATAEEIYEAAKSCYAEIRKQTIGKINEY